MASDVDVEHTLTQAAHQNRVSGLKSRVQNPFEFLGLYGTHHEACHWHDIQAKMVSSNEM